jgi:hypothetical protein
MSQPPPSQSPRREQHLILIGQGSSSGCTGEEYEPWPLDEEQLVLLLETLPPRWSPAEFFERMNPSQAPTGFVERMPPSHEAVTELLERMPPRMETWIEFFKRMPQRPEAPLGFLGLRRPSDVDTAALGYGDIFVLASFFLYVFFWYIHPL